MKNEIFKYLEYSLFVHNYVIVPGLGGFIVNSSPFSAHLSMNIEPPRFSIVFNPDLNHDDGILASYIIKDEKISYNAASQRIKDFVKEIKSNLANGKNISFNLGNFYLDNDNNISFTINQSVAHPDFFGLTPVELVYLSNIKDTSRKESNRVFLRNALSGVAAIGIAAFLFIIPSADISDKGHTKSQEAGYIHTLTNTLSLSKNDEIRTAQPDMEEIIDTPARTYYIIVGGEDFRPRAKRLLDKVRLAGFKDAAIVESQGRYRIYVASFTDKVESESFLETFRKDNPKFNTAWLYSKRNK